MVALACSQANVDVGESSSTSLAQARADLVGEATLPDPEIWRVAPRELTAEALARKADVDSFLWGEYQKAGVRIVATTQNYSGDIIDWVDPDSVPGSRAIPPKLNDGEEASQLGPSSAGRGRMEVEEFPELMGPKGTIPFYRPSYARYVDGKSRFDTIEEHVANPVMGRTDGATNLYAGYRKTGNIYYARSYMPNWRSGTVSDGTFTLVEMSVSCDTAGGNEIVGAVASRDRANWGDDPSDGLTPEIVGPSRPLLRLQVETYSTGIYSEWAVAPFTSQRWVPYAGAPYGPGAAFSNSAISTVDGTQYETRFDWVLDSGNWWLRVNMNWLGYYPASGLTSFPGGRGCYVHWYGEVHDPSPSTWTGNDMASSRFASEGWMKAARVRDPLYCTNSTWTTCNNASGASLLGLQDSACYTTSGITDIGGGLGFQFFMGGPGRVSSGGAVTCP